MSRRVVTVLSDGELTQVDELSEALGIQEFERVRTLRILIRYALANREAVQQIAGETGSGSYWRGFLEED